MRLTLDSPTVQDAPALTPPVELITHAAHTFDFTQSIIVNRQ